MWTRLFGGTEAMANSTPVDSLSPFDRVTDFEMLRSIIAELRIRQGKIQTESHDLSIASVDKKKLTLLSNLLNVVDAETEKYNQSKDHDTLDRLRCIVEMSAGLINVLAPDGTEASARENLKTLFTQRGQIPFSTGAHFGAVGTLVAAAGPASALGAIVLGVGAHLALRISENVFGYDPAPESAKLFTKLMAELVAVMNKLLDDVLLDASASKLSKEQVEDVVRWAEKMRQCYPEAHFTSVDKLVVSHSPKKS